MLAGFGAALPFFFFALTVSSQGGRRGRRQWLGAASRRCRERRPNSTSASSRGAACGSAPALGRFRVLRESRVVPYPAPCPFGGGSALARQAAVTRGRPA